MTFVPVDEYVHSTHHLIWGEKFLVLEGNRLECHPWQPCVRAGCNQPCTMAQGEIINYCPKLATLSPPWLQHTQTVLRPKPNLRLFWANLTKSFCSFLHCLPQGLSSVVALSQSYIQAPWKTWATKGLGMVQEKFVLHRFQSVLKGLYMQMDFILGWGKSCWVCKWEKMGVRRCCRVLTSGMRCIPNCWVIMAVIPSTGAILGFS